MTEEEIDTLQPGDRLTVFPYPNSSLIDIVTSILFLEKGSDHIFCLMAFNDGHTKIHTLGFGDVERAI